MAYYTNLYSPQTYEIFGESDRTISGFRINQKNAASRIQIGDRFICYMTKLSRWIGVLEVTSEWFEDDTPLFEENDPFIIRFRVHPIVWLEKEKTVPIHDDRVWDNLTFTRNQDKKSSSWTGMIRGSLRPFNEDDAQFLEDLLLHQAQNGEIFEVDADEYNKYLTHKVRRLDKTVSVSVPQEELADLQPDETISVRESIEIQALLARIGAKMGMQIWVPRNDRNLVLNEIRDIDVPFLDVLPLNYNEPTLKTIEQIDVLWLRGRAIVRAFEVEHTTSIYSGILRMADLLALQPNMDIKLHIVAPYDRQDRVFQQLKRPVFSLLEKGPLSDICTYISYDSLRELSALKHLHHYSDTVLDEYAEIAE